MSRLLLVASLLMLSTVAAMSGVCARSPAAIEPQADTSVIANDGSAHVTRVIPVPSTVSPQAQRKLATSVEESHTHRSLAQIRIDADAVQTEAGAAFEQRKAGTIRSASVGGVPVRIITPTVMAEEHRTRLLIDLHGGGGTQDTGSLTEALPLAEHSQTRVISVLYRLAPEHPFPAAVDDAVAVYRAILKTHRPDEIAIYGTSSGAILAAQLAVRLKALRLPMPGALGLFSTTGDASRNGDSQAMFSQTGLSGPLSVPEPPKDAGYYGSALSLKDPQVSPLFSNLHGLPPTLFLTSTRDMLLSGTTMLHRAFLEADVDARLVVFEALPHAFWEDPTLPETDEAVGIMVHFFDDTLGQDRHSAEPRRGCRHCRAPLRTL